MAFYYLIDNILRPLTTGDKLWLAQNKDLNQVQKQRKSNMDADYLVVIVISFSCFVNRQSIIFLCAFSAMEFLFLFEIDAMYESLFFASSFSAIAYLSSKIKFELQMALCAYAVLYWFNALDFFLFPHETLFYVIFPYVVKFVDIYVIFHLINKEQKDVGIHSSPNCSFN